MLFEY